MREDGKCTAVGYRGCAVIVDGAIENAATDRVGSPPTLALAVQLDSNSTTRPDVDLHFSSFEVDSSPRVSYESRPEVASRKSVSS